MRPALPVRNDIKLTFVRNDVKLTSIRNDVKLTVRNDTKLPTPKRV